MEHMHRHGGWIRKQDALATLEALRQKFNDRSPCTAQPRPNNGLRDRINDPAQRAEGEPKRVRGSKPGWQREFGRLISEELQPSRKTKHKRSDEEAAGCQPGEQVIIEPGEAATPLIHGGPPTARARPGPLRPR